MALQEQNQQMEGSVSVSQKDKQKSQVSFQARTLNPAKQCFRNLNEILSFLQQALKDFLATHQARPEIDLGTPPTSEVKDREQQASTSRTDSSSHADTWRRRAQMKIISF